MAISNNRILRLEEGQVTFEYKESATDKTKSCRLSAEEFIRRFLQHVLPERFVKVRYYGLMSVSNRDLVEEARRQLSGSEIEEVASEKESIVKEPVESVVCPQCGREKRLIERLKPQSREPP